MEKPAVTWNDATRQLAALVGTLCHLDTTYLELSGRVVLSCQQESDTVDLSVNDEPAAPLRDDQRTTLAAKGWTRSNWTDTIWHQSVPWTPTPETFRKVATLTVTTLRDVLQIASPDHLTTNLIAENDDNMELSFPYDTTGLQSALTAFDERRRNLDLLSGLTNHGMAMAHPHARLIARIPHPPARDNISKTQSDYSQDTIYLIPDPEYPYLLVLSHIGPSGHIGRRIVRLHPESRCDWISQNQPLYVRALLESNPHLAAAFKARPGLRAELVALLGSGHPDVVRARSYAFDGNALTANDFHLNANQLDLATLIVADK